MKITTPPHPAILGQRNKSRRRKRGGIVLNFNKISEEMNSRRPKVLEMLEKKDKTLEEINICRSINGMKARAEKAKFWRWNSTFTN